MKVWTVLRGACFVWIRETWKGANNLPTRPRFADVLRSRYREVQQAIKKRLGEPLCCLAANGRQMSRKWSATEPELLYSHAEPVQRIRPISRDERIERADLLALQLRLFL